MDAQAAEFLAGKIPLKSLNRKVKANINKVFHFIALHEEDKNQTLSPYAQRVYSLFKI